MNTRTFKKLIDILNRMEELTSDSELGDNINEAVMSLESAHDRLIAITEELSAEIDEAEEEFNNG